MFCGGGGLCLESFWAGQIKGSNPSLSALFGPDLVSGAHGGAADQPANFRFSELGQKTFRAGFRTPQVGLAQKALRVSV